MGSNHSSLDWPFFSENSTVGSVLAAYILQMSLDRSSHRKAGRPSGRPFQPSLFPALQRQDSPALAQRLRLARRQALKRRSDLRYE